MNSLMLLAVLKPDGWPLPAMPCGPARRLTSGPLDAVVFARPKAGLFHPAPKALAKDLLAHQRSLEILEPGRTILPGAFGASFRSEADAIAFLDANATRLHDLLAIYGGQREYRVTVSCKEADQPALAERLSKTAQITASGLPPRDMLRQHFRAAITAASSDTLEMPTDSPETILNLVVLIGAGSEDRLDAALAEIDALAPDRLRIRSAGPLPACSFASLASDPVSAKQIDTACAALGLVRDEGRAGPEMVDIRQAFARQARAAHPDAGGNPAAFESIRRSFALLRALRGQDRTAGSHTPPPLLRVVRADHHHAM